MNALRNVKWLLIIVSSLGLMVFLLLADVVFVTYYAQITNPGRALEFYSRFAQNTAGAFIFCFAPFPIYILSRWICRKAGENFYLHAILLIVFFHVIDVIMLVSIGQLQGILRIEFFLNMTAMFCGALAGGFFADREHKAELSV